ncbi:hypothetical protein ACIP5Y_21260 [Nocardia sp. NPDC088792]|uniref:hypothetical protein n=1 Tax=Nocardia sp. NPDC088792 TaxID=3364332 RepID=UPI00381D2C4B
MNPTLPPTQVRLLRDIHTDKATFPKGLRVEATPDGDEWILHLDMPSLGVKSLSQRVPAEWVHQHGHTVAAYARRIDAHEQYWFARNCLGFDDEKATLWLSEEIGRSLKTLRLWGFHTGRLEKQERAQREQQRVMS